MRASNRSKEGIHRRYWLPKIGDKSEQGLKSTQLTTDTLFTAYSSRTNALKRILFSCLQPNYAKHSAGR